MFKFHRNVKKHSPLAMLIATYARRDCDFLSRMTTARGVGLQDSSNFDRHLVCTDSSGSSTAHRAVPSPHDSSDMFFEHVAPQCLSDPREKCPHTERLSEEHQPQEAHAHHGPNKTLLPPSARRDTSSLPALQFCSPRLNHSLQLGKFLECGSCPLSPLCVVTAIQTREIHGNSVGTRQQLMASVEARHQSLLTHCGSHFHEASISGCLC